MYSVKWIFFSLTLLVSQAVLAATAVAVKEKVHLEDEVVWLFVNKESLTASLLTLPPFPQEPVELQSFRIAIGKEKGDKIQEGDNRTPEGVYFTLNHLPEQNLLVAQYGRLAIPLDFPNVFDQLEGKTGYGIWLHGAGNDNRIASENVTRGCVAFYNDDIIKLRNWLTPRQGIVMISKDAESVNIGTERKEISDLTEQWYTSWDKRNLASYLDFYSDKFEHEKMDRAAFGKYKARVFASYKQMKVTTKAVRILTHPKYAVAIMNQTFQGDERYRSEGRKVLYWHREKGNWKILRETFSLTTLNKHTLSEDRLQSLRPLLTQRP